MSEDAGNNIEHVAEEAVPQKRSYKSLHLVLKHKALLIIVFAIGFVLVFGPTIFANLSTRNKRHNLNDPKNIPTRQIALVFGAGVSSDGTPTPYLKQRIETAINLYMTGKVKKILMSGDNSSKHYNEPTAMKEYAVNHGVKDQDVIIDYAGFNTYDSCYRAKTIFDVHEALVITQGYHLPRAVMTCNDLGIKTDGVAATKNGRDFTITYIMREYISTTKSTLQLLAKPKPTVLGNPEPIQF